MSTVAIDTARTSERLSAFLSEIGANEPVDNFFPKVPVIEKFMANKKMVNGGRQVLTPIDSGENSTVQDFSDYDTFSTSAQNTALSVVYPMVNKGGTVVISWEEIRETAGSDHRIFDLIKHKRDNLTKSIINSLATDLFAASQATNKISSLATTIDATGATGGLNQSTDADWASTETASGGAFATNGLADMRTTFNTIADNGAEPDMIVTTPTVYQLYENTIDPDVRYMKVQGKSVGGRGFGGGLEFNGIPVMRDLKCTASTMYFINTENLFFMIDTDGNMSTEEFAKQPNQKAFASIMTFRGNLVCNRRKSHGKITGIS